ncbi:MAG: Rieske 2Fe-2S domain-containing protein [Geodermatophilaceae bacterium]|nr:Rieske 2Fe-2S domain-containing protein [Geodermatophilaceae bacterium]
MTDDEFQAAAGQLDALVQEFETLPFPEIREMVFDLLQAVDAIHRESLGRLVGFLRQQGQADLVDRAAEEPVIRLLLLLYDLVPDAELARGEPANFIPLHEIGEAISTSAIIPASMGPVRRARALPFKEAARVEEVPLGAMKAVEVDGVRVLLFNVAGELYAVLSECPGSMAPLHLGNFSSPVLTCPWHNEAYDVRSGERVDGWETPKLNMIPVAVVDGTIQVAVQAPSKAAPSPVS